MHYKAAAIVIVILLFSAQSFGKENTYNKWRSNSSEYNKELLRVKRFNLLNFLPKITNTIATIKPTTKEMSSSSAKNMSNLPPWLLRSSASASKYIETNEKQTAIVITTVKPVKTTPVKFQYLTSITLFYLKLPIKGDICVDLVCSKNSETIEYKFKNITKAEVPEGLLVTQCGANKHFLMSKEKMVQDKIFKYCCSLGMATAVIETQDELNCLNEQYNNTRETYFKDSNSSGQFYLSYFDQTRYRVFRSCPDKIELPSELWGPQQPNNLGKLQNCVTVKFSSNKTKAGLDDVAYLESYNVMCQYHVPFAERKKRTYSAMSLKMAQFKESKRNSTDVCADNRCKKNSTYSDVAMQKMHMSSGIFISTCGTKHYFFPKSKKTGLQIWDICCSWGMKPAEILTRDELNCVNEAFDKAEAQFKFKDLNQFLVSYNDLNLTHTYSSCNLEKGAGEVPMHLWAKGQPDNLMTDETCVVLRFGNPNTVGYHDIGCMNLNYHVCQYETGDATPPAKNVTESPSIRQYKALFNKALIKPTASESSANSNTGLNLTNSASISLSPAVPKGMQSVAKSPHCNPVECKNRSKIKYKYHGVSSTTEGILITNCGIKHFYINASLILSTKLEGFCCSLGMQGGVIETKEEFDCVMQAYTESSLIKLSKGKIDYFFMSGFNNINKDGNYVSCQDKKMPKELTIPNFKPNKVDLCTGLRFHLSEKSSGYSLVSCLVRNYIICQMDFEGKAAPAESETYSTKTFIVKDYYG